MQVVKKSYSVISRRSIIWTHLYLVFHLGLDLPLLPLEGSVKLQRWVAVAASGNHLLSVVHLLDNKLPLEVVLVHTAVAVEAVVSGVQQDPRLETPVLEVAAVEELALGHLHNLPVHLEDPPEAPLVQVLARLVAGVVRSVPLPPLAPLAVEVCLCSDALNTK
jgi:hypothetical protein